jgi:hypothetical protein
MRIPLSQRIVPALGLGLALSYGSASSLFAQGLPPSSGSGSGTGTGMSSGYPGSTGTGRESSSGLGTTGTGRESLGSRPEPGAFPAMNLTRPIDLPGSADIPRSGGMSTVTPDLFLDARSIRDPGERALALVRIAQTAIFSRQFNEAHTALFEAGPAALAEKDRLIREQRLTAIIDSLLRLCEERMVDDVPVDPMPLTSPTYAPPTLTPPTSGSNPPPPPAPATSPNPLPPPAPAPPSTPPVSTERITRLKAALPEWAYSVDLSRQIDNATARTEALFRIAESESFCSQKLITDPLIRSGVRPDPTKIDNQLKSYTDYLLEASAWHAGMIERPIWRDYAYFRIISNAANSSQFRRGFEIARGIQQPEARTDSLIRLAEGQAINGRPTEATAAWEEAARSVTLIPQEDPRETLVGVLIDSLITYGRFDDARACVPLYAFPSRQLTALAAVAESQGRRNLAESARQWIAQENLAFQPLLYRKVNDGILASIELNRSKELNSRSMSAPVPR